MNRWSAGAVIATMLATSATAHAVELSYQWKKGSAYRFEAKSEDVVGMAGMGMNVDQTFHTASTFAIKVKKVKPDGSALADLTVEAFEVKLADGRKVAGLESLPKDALKTLVEVDRKGNFQAKERVFIIVDDAGQNLLVTGRASGTGVSATGEAGGEQVTVYAKFDPKTGQLSGGYSKKTIGKKTSRVAVMQDKPMVDVLPMQFLQLLKLPDGDLAAGGKADLGVSAPGMDSGTTIAVTLKELTAERAKIQVQVASKTDAQVAPAQGEEQKPVEAHAEAEGGGMAMQMPAMPGMGAMPGMQGMPGMPAAAPGGGAASMGMKVDGAFDVDFALKKGMLDGLSGTMNSATEMAGMMKMTTATTLTLKRL